MDDHVGVFTAESLLHLQLIQAAAEKRGTRVPVLLRLTAGSQFGMDEQEVLQIICNRDAYTGIEIVGLHYFSGTQKRKVALIEKELDYLLQFVAQVAGVLTNPEKVAEVLAAPDANAVRDIFLVR
jgi:diaminopimelate decarboxylase